MVRKILSAGSRKASTNVPKSRYHGSTNVLGDKLAIWAGNGGCVEEVWNNFKSIILQGIERFIPLRILRKNADPNSIIRKQKN
jgi:hypothetical protein